MTVSFDISQVPVIYSQLDYQLVKRGKLYSVWSTANLHPSLSLMFINQQYITTLHRVTISVVVFEVFTAM